jgi:hypothetical protein
MSSLQDGDYSDPTGDRLILITHSRHWMYVQFFVCDGSCVPSLPNRPGRGGALPPWVVETPNSSEAVAVSLGRPGQGAQVRAELQAYIASLKIIQPVASNRGRIEVNRMRYWDAQHITDSLQNRNEISGDHRQRAKQRRCVSHQRACEHLGA